LLRPKLGLNAADVLTFGLFLAQYGSLLAYEEIFADFLSASIAYFRSVSDV
jgi:hypothetical protein